MFIVVILLWLSLFDQDMLKCLYIIYYLDRTLLAHIRTEYSTCHKLNESFVCVQVFQVTGVYVQVPHSF